MTLAAGDCLGPYEVLGPIGAGGMGQVWRARDSRLGREVALELLPADLASDPDRLRRFEREARATAALSHPNILAIFDVGSHDGVPYLVEELLEGETLARRIRSGDLTVGRSVALAVQVARGLSAAHERGIVHRDLKPDKVFVTRDGVVKILDFGLARATVTDVVQDAATEASPESEMGVVVGTPAYMAPEQARGRSVDHRADLFALGVVLYEMVAGTRPFAGDSRADLVAHAPPRWRCLVATPGQAPFVGLARALAAFFAGEVEVMQRLIEFQRLEVGPALVERWAEGCDGALVVVDQFEELFTQSGEEVQARFVELLGRLAELDGVHVLLSLRDDYLLRCNAHAALKPVFLDLTPLDPPAGDALRRAMVEPARRHGFAFEDEALVDEMLAAVEGERGALPLLAFAVSRLWEERDRQRKLLTREAYARIGGVAGALAQHAEATLEKLDEGSVPLVRELFRNLTTSEQTRCVLEWEELLSVFRAEQGPEAERVLAALVDARLVTSFELEGADGTWHHRVEVVHESLLRSWPRLVRWQAQDEEGALLRDQLRQAARLWGEKGRPADLLWSGASFREYQVWRERYPGGLSAVEEAFGDAMVALAGRRRRRRRIAVAATILVLGGVLAVVSTSLRDTRRALAASDASKLVALGRAAGVEADPTEALAYAIASLERADSPDARMLALGAVAHGPIAFIAEEWYAFRLAFSPDGRCCAGSTPVRHGCGRGTAHGPCSGSRRPVAASSSPRTAASWSTSLTP